MASQRASLRRRKAIAASSPVMPAANRGTASDRRFLHDDEPRSLEVLDQPLGKSRPL
jgi:hypothetical protein